jgi:hypothetical protein
MGRSSREWKVSKDLEGGSYYLHEDTGEDTKKKERLNMTGQPRVKEVFSASVKTSGRYLIVYTLIASSTRLTINYYVMVTKPNCHKKEINNMTYVHNKIFT